MTIRRPAHVLDISPFRRLWMAMSASSLGDWLTLLALSALAAQLTAASGYQAQAAAVGGVFLAKLLPALLFGPLAGPLTVRLDRRLTMFVADLARFVLVVSVPLIGLYQWVVAAAFLIECATLFWGPARDATVPALVPKERQEEATRFGVLVTYGTAPVAALLFTVLTTAGQWMVAGGALAYLLSAALVFTLRGLPRRGVAASTPSVLEGWRASGRDGVARGVRAGLLATAAAGGALIGVSVLGGAVAYGVVFGALCVGVAAGLFFGPRVLTQLSRLRLFGASVVAVAAALVVIALVRDQSVVVMLTVVLGLCAGVAWRVGMEVLDGSFVEPVAKVSLLLAAAVVAPAAGLAGGAMLALLAMGGLMMVVGALALRRVDDRKGVPLSEDMLAALRGERYTSGDVEEVPGVFIAFEGGEGSGKTTQSRLLAIWLRDQGFDVVQTREPGSTKVGMRLRAILLDAAEKGLSPRAEALMYAADRAEHVEKVIRPALERGALVITDRYVDSSLAYQGAGRALDPADVAEVNAWATSRLVPHLTVLIDTPPSVGLTRLGGAADRIESEPMEFHERVRKEFRTLAAAAPERYLVVDGTLPLDDISRTVQDRVREILPDPVPSESEDITGTMPAIRD
ncbi:dTMP kinase [Nonomuraea sp. NPDC049152]|uniref:dTMP kinase n=1 Tax=Nonomuraea sp. NPDC049152 TaxID=3154350 RepID=UPI0033E52A0B